MASLVESNQCRFAYPPLRPLVLEQFQASEVDRTGRGRTGGTTRAAFEATVPELERKAHPPMTALPEYHAKFFQVALTLAAFTVAEATAPVTETRKADILEFLNLSPEQFEKVVSETDWNWQEAGNAEAKLQHHLANQRERAANIHSVEIIDRCVRMVLREHDGGLPEAVGEALDRIGNRCYLNAKEVKALLSALTGNILAKDDAR